MIVADLNELAMYPVADRGQPNLERIPIFVRETTDLGCYGVMLGVRRENGLTLPVQDNLFWFGDGMVNSGDWILLYTGSGRATTTDWTTPPGSKIYTIHWGRHQTMFADSLLVPILFRTDSIQITAPPADVPQIGYIGS